MARDWKDYLPADWPNYLRAAWNRQEGGDPPEGSEPPAPYDPPGSRNFSPEWAALCEAWSRDRGYPICGGKRSNGWPCQARRIKDMTKCARHGGKSPVGPASPHWQHGGRSYHVPQALAEKYNEALEDEAFIELRSEFALAVARHQQLLDQIDTGESEAAWRRARGKLSDVVVALAEGHDVTGAIQAMQEVLDEGLGEQAIWRELRENADHMRKLAMTERRRLELLQQYITAEKGTALVARMLAVVRQHCTREQLAAMVGDLMQDGILTRNGGPQSRPIPQLGRGPGGDS